MCRAEYLNHVRVREWQDLVRQLREVASELGLRRNDGSRPTADAVHRALLAGLLSHVGMYDRTTRDHVGARQARFAIARGSVLHRQHAGVGDGRRAGRDQPPVGPHGGPHRARVGRARGRAPGAPQLRRAVVGRPPGRGA